MSQDQDLTTTDVDLSTSLKLREDETHLSPAAPSQKESEMVPVVLG